MYIYICNSLWEQDLWLMSRSIQFSPLRVEKSTKKHGDFTVPSGKACVLVEKSQEWQALIWHSSWLVSKCSSVWFKTPGWNLQKTHGSWQLLFQISGPSSPMTHQPINDSPRNTNSDASTVPRWCWVLQQVLAAAVAVLITILDNFPYGFLLFPEGRGDPGVGISMVLLSAALAQVVFAMQSDLPVGCWVRKYGCFRKSWIFTD